jgi:hypothetical protein
MQSNGLVVAVVAKSRQEQTRADKSRQEQTRADKSRQGQGRRELHESGCASMDVISCLVDGN